MKAAIVIGSGVAIMAGWTVASSAILCWSTGQMSAFVFPWWQWWYGLAWFSLPWRLGWLGDLAVAASGGFTALLPLAIAVLVVAAKRYQNRRRQPSLHGDTGFATPAQMDNGGFKSSKRLFDR